MSGDAFDRFQPRDRGRFGDNESGRNDRVVKSDLVDLDLILHNDNPSKKAIAVSLSPTTPFAQWVWLARSLIEYEMTGTGVNGSSLVRVTMPERIAIEKRLI